MSSLRDALSPVLAVTWALDEVFNSGPVAEGSHALPEQAVRTVFNIAIGADTADIQRTARSALLQMLNTIMKRIAQLTIVSPAAHCCI